MKTFDQCQSHPVYCAIKQSTIDTINLYVTDGIPAGDFVRAVLANDLMQAFGRADMENRLSLFQITSYIYNEVPLSICGTYEIYEYHLKAMDAKRESKEVTQ